MDGEMLLRPADGEVEVDSQMQPGQADDGQEPVEDEVVGKANQVVAHPSQRAHGQLCSAEKQRRDEPEVRKGRVGRRAEDTVGNLLLGGNGNTFDATHADAKNLKMDSRRRGVLSSSLP